MLKSIENKWYACSVYSRQEKAAFKDITNLGYEAFLPIRQERRLWSDRIKTLETALFPGYLFVRTHLTASSRVDIIRSKKVLDFVGRLKGREDRLAHHIPNSEMESLKLITCKEEKIEPVERLRRGEKVMVIDGPLKGLYGTLEKRAKGDCRIVVGVTLLGRGVSAKLEPSQVMSLTELKQEECAA